MTCKHCGANLMPDEKMCSYCRCLVEEPQPSPPPVSSRIMPPYLSESMRMTPAKPRSKKATLCMCLLGFLGVGGIHRLYAGKIWTGLIWLFTWGLFGFGTMIDLILILMDQFHDKDGNLLQ